MRDYFVFFGSREWVWALPMYLFAVGCGSSDGGATAALLSQEPRCPEKAGALRIQGTVAGSAIDDVRTANINAGYENANTGKFYTPLTDLAPLASNQLALTLTWGGGLFDGQTGPGTGGMLIMPGSDPNAGKQYCVTQSEVGFVSGGAEDGVFKFAITQIQADPNPMNGVAVATCAGALTPVDVRGCYQ